MCAAPGLASCAEAPSSRAVLLMHFTALSASAASPAWPRHVSARENAAPPIMDRAATPATRGADLPPRSGWRRSSKSLLSSRATSGVWPRLAHTASPSARRGSASVPHPIQLLPPGFSRSSPGSAGGTRRSVPATSIGCSDPPGLVAPPRVRHQSAALPAHIALPKPQPQPAWTSLWPPAHRTGSPRWPPRSSPARKGFVRSPPHSPELAPEGKKSRRHRGQRRTGCRQLIQPRRVWSGCGSSGLVSKGAPHSGQTSASLLTSAPCFSRRAFSNSRPTQSPASTAGPSNSFHRLSLS